MLAFASCIEPLRAANRIAGEDLYRWPVYSAAGEPVEASNGVCVTADASFDAAHPLSMAVVCSGIDVERQSHAQLIATLRRLSVFGSALGAVCTGSYVLAKAGLLDGASATIHWENQPSFVAEFPDIPLVPELFRIDGKRYTCAGGTAPVDMMLSVIAEDHGTELAAEVTDLLVHHRSREATERQRMDKSQRFGITHPKLCNIMEMMENTTDSPLSCAQLAEAGGLSVRQLERLFAKYMGRSPGRHYLAIRLERARWLLRQTSLPILSVAVSCGFCSPSHFSKSYQDQFGRTPTAERQRSRRPVAPAAPGKSNRPS